MRCCWIIMDGGMVMLLLVLVVRRAGRERGRVSTIMEKGGRCWCDDDDWTFEGRHHHRYVCARLLPHCWGSTTESGASRLFVIYTTTDDDVDVHTHIEEIGSVVARTESSTWRRRRRRQWLPMRYQRWWNVCGKFGKFGTWTRIDRCNGIGIKCHCLCSVWKELNRKCLEQSQLRSGYC